MWKPGPHMFGHLKNVRTAECDSTPVRFTQFQLKSEQWQYFETAANTPGGFHSVTENGVIVSCVWQNRFLEIQAQTTERALLARKKNFLLTVRNLEKDQGHMGAPSHWWPAGKGGEGEIQQEGKDRKRYGTVLRHVSKQGGKPPLNDHDASSLWWKRTILSGMLFRVYKG